jgi:SET domain-containing protein
MDILTMGDLVLRVSEGKGRGVFALKPFQPFDIIMVNPVLVFDVPDVEKITSTAFGSYQFSWPFHPDGRPIDEEEDDSPYSCIPFGLISLINHAGADRANANWRSVFADLTMVAYAIKPIAAGEEIFWNYNWSED